MILSLDKIRAISPWLVVVSMVAMLSISVFPFSNAMRIVLSCLAAFYLFDYFINRRWQYFVFNREKVAYLLMIAFFLLAPIHQLFDPTPPTGYFHYQLESYLPFLIIGAVGFLGITNKLKPTYFALSMSSVGLIIFVVLNIRLLLAEAYNSFGEYIYSYNLLRNTISSHMVFDLYINIAIIFGLCALQIESAKWMRISLCVLLLFDIISLFFSTGRVGCASLAIILIVYAIYIVVKRKKWKVLVPVLLVLMTLSFLAIKSNPRFNLIQDDLRWKIWRYSLELVQEKPIFGYGVSTLSEEYIERAIQDSEMNQYYINGLLQLDDFINMERTMLIVHPHNAFLLVWLQHGLIGLCVMIAMLCFIAMMRLQQNRIYLWLVLAVIIGQAMFEPIGAHLQPIIICFSVLILESFFNPSRQPL